MIHGVNDPLPSLFLRASDSNMLLTSVPSGRATIWLKIVKLFAPGL